MKKPLKNAVSCTLAGIMAFSSLSLSAFGQSYDEAIAYEAVSTEAEALPAEELAEFEEKKEADYTYGDFGYNVLNDETISIVDYTGESPVVVIPSEIEGRKVTNIGINAFWGNSITSVTIPNSVTSISQQAFRDCVSLTTLTIPDSVLTIGDYAFMYCSGLVSVKIGNGVTSISNSAFVSCTSLTSLTIGTGVVNIGKGAFLECTSLTKVTIPDGVTAIGEEAFRDCDSLVSVSLPDSLVSLGSSAFHGCGSLTSIVIPEGVTIINGSTFYWCKNLTSVVIPNTVTAIGGNAFSGCSNLLSINIPDSVITIGDCAFSECDRFTSVTIPDSVISIGGNVFYSCDNLKSVTIPNSVVSIGGCAFKYCTSLKSIKLPNSIVSIAAYAFEDCTSLKEIIIPDTVVSIGVSAFNDCSSLTDVYYSGSEEEWNDIVVENNNDELNNASIYYNFNLKTPKATAYAGNGKVTLKWSAVEGVQKYRIYSYANGKHTKIADTTGTSYTVTGLSNGTNYTYLVRSYACDLWSDFKSTDRVSVTPINKPVISNVYPGNGKAIVKWGAIDGATKYAIYTYSGGKYTHYKNTTLNYYNVTGLTNGTKYGFLVKAYVNGAWTSYNAYDLAYATPVEKPVVTAYAGNGKVRLNWTKVTGATKYAIYTYSGGKYTHYKNTTLNYYNVTGLTNGTSYGFLVRAYVNGAWTTYNAYDRVSATPIDKPVITKTVAADGRVRLYWNKVAGATKYAIYTYSGGKYTIYKYTTANAYTVSGLTNGTSYGFLVRAYVNGAWTTYNVYDRVSATPKA